MQIETSPAETHASVVTGKTIMTPSGDMVTGQLLSADDELFSYVEEMLHTDKRFKGMSSYVYDVNFYWSMAIDTACAGHGFIFFNPQWWDKMVHEERKTVISHEIWHLILNHLPRGQGKDPESYAQAIDHVVNLTCHHDGFITKLSPGGGPTDFGDMGMIIDQRFDGMGTDAIYSIIHEERKDDPNSHPPSGGPSSDQIEDLVQQALQGTGKDLTQVAEENEEAAKQAQADGKAAGNQSGGTQIVLESDGKKVFIQSASYEEIFVDYLTDPLSGGKRTYMRPSRRQMRGGLKLKGKYPKRGRKNRLTHLVYALDISGSITEHQRNQFIASAKTLKETLNPILMTIILWDTSIQFEKVFREDEVLDNIPTLGGGGTDLDPVYQRVEQINPEALVIFTDLAVTIPPKPTWETIWFVPDMNVYTGYLQAVTYGDVYLVPEP